MAQVILFGEGIDINVRPLAIYRLASHLRQKNITTQPIWAWKSLPDIIFQSICEVYLNKDVQVVGISTTLLQFPLGNFWGMTNNEFSKRIALIRAFAPNAKIVAGGSQIFHTPMDQIPLANLIDIFVQGQGEEVLTAIVDAVTNKTLIRTISVTPQITNQDIYPFNDFTTSGTFFSKEDHIIPGEAMSFEFARGCIFKCSFCSYDLLGKKIGDYTKTKHTMREELIHNYNEHGTVDYVITDDLINDSEEKINLLLDLTQSLPFKIYYSGYLRLDLLRRFPGTISKLKDSGLIGCFMGIETVNDQSGKAVGKGLGKERTTEAMEMLLEGWKQQVFVETALILGLPHDNTDTKFELIEWLKHPVVSKVTKSLTVNPLYINLSRSSDIDQDPAKFGYEVDSHNNWTTKNYSFQQARADVAAVYDFFASTRKYNKKYPAKINNFKLPYLLSLAEDRNAVLDVLLNDHSDIWPTDEHWKIYFKNVAFKHRRQYLESLLGKHWKRIFKDPNNANLLNIMKREQNDRLN